MGLLDGQTAHSYYSGTNLGNYQFISLEDIINQYIAIYIGEGKIIPKARRVDVAFHAQRALQELSFDTFKSCKSQEITLPPSLVMPLPQDYVNYVKLSWVDNAGIQRIIYPMSKSSNPMKIAQEANGNYIFDNDNLTTGTHPGTPDGLIQFPYTFELTDGLNAGVSSIFLKPSELGFDPFVNSGYADTITAFSVGMEINCQHFPVGTTITEVKIAAGGLDHIELKLSNASTNILTVPTAVPITILNSSSTWNKFKSHTPLENQDYYQNGYDIPYNEDRYGMDTGEFSQTNGYYYIDCASGKIHFSSNISGKTVILEYISDGLGTDGEMKVHKFAEEAMYKWISHAILAGSANTPEYLVARFKKERYAAIRTAKLRLSNINIEEITQILRGQSKQLKH